MMTPRSRPKKGRGEGLGSEPVDSEQGIVRVAPGGPTDLTNDRAAGVVSLYNTSTISFYLLLCLPSRVSDTDHHSLYAFVSPRFH
jgi:hypothetical protein